MLDLAPKHLEMVRAILQRRVPKARAWAFGSRVKGTAQRFSDLDLALENEEPLSLRTLALLDADFAESDLPIKVDVVDLRTVAPAFRERVERTGLPLNT